MDIAFVQFDDHLDDEHEGKKLHNPRPIDELRLDVLIKFFSRKKRQDTGEEQDAPCGSCLYERSCIGEVHAGEDAAEQLVGCVHVGRAEEGPAEGDEAHCDKARDGDGKCVVADVAKDGA